MQIGAGTTRSQSLPSATLSGLFVAVVQSRFSLCGMIRCNGAVTSLESSEIPVAATEAFLDVDSAQAAASSGLQPQGIDGGLGKPLALGGQTASTPDRAPHIGPIG